MECKVCAGYQRLRAALRPAIRDQLWGHLDYTAQVYITNNQSSEAAEVAAEYNGRAEIEALIAELKNGVGIAKVPSRDFNANQTSFLLKLLTHNLVRRYAAEYAPDLPWRGPWLMRALFLVPGRLTRSGRCTRLHTPPSSLLDQSLKVRMAVEFIAELDGFQEVASRPNRFR